MCLLAHKPASVRFSHDDIADIYAKNEDGFGVMYAENRTLHTEKIVGSLDDVWKLYKEHEHRDLLMHFRMRTHGNIDYANCHPYWVFGPEFEGEETIMPIALMHNGVLSTGNAKDASKSDTWHYIRDYIRPCLKDNYELLLEPAFQDLVSKHIGASNKFALLTAEGHCVIINRSSGVDWKRDDGTVWMSNTYAWSSHKAGYGKKSSTVYYGSWGDDDSWPLRSVGKKVAKGPLALLPSRQNPKDEWVADFWEALQGYELYTAYSRLTNADVEATYDILGDELAQLVLDDLAYVRMDSAVAAYIEFVKSHKAGDDALSQVSILDFEDMHAQFLELGEEEEAAEEVDVPEPPMSRLTAPEKARLFFTELGKKADDRKAFQFLRFDEAASFFASLDDYEYAAFMRALPKMEQEALVDLIAPKRAAEFNKAATA